MYKIEGKKQTKILDGMEGKKSNKFLNVPLQNVHQFFDIIIRLLGQIHFRVPHHCKDDCVVCLVQVLKIEFKLVKIKLNEKKPTTSLVKLGDIRKNGTPSASAKVLQCETGRPFDSVICSIRQLKRPR